MLTNYLQHHPDQAFLGLSLILFMLWQEKSQPRQFKVLALVFAITTLLIIQRSVDIQGYYYALFMVLHLGFFSQMARHLNKPKEMLFFGLAWAFAAHLLIEARDWMMVFVGGELFSLPLYAWFASSSAKDNAIVALRYFIQNAVLGALFLIALSLYFYEYHSLNFAAYKTFASSSIIWVFIMSWFSFKLGIAPLSHWVNQVYGLLSCEEILWLSLLPKFALIAALAQIAINCWPVGSFEIPQKIFLIALMITTLWGHAAAWREESWSDFFAYSAVAQNGFVIAPLLIGGEWVFISFASQIAYAFSLWLIFKYDFSRILGYRLGLLSLSGFPPFPLFFIKILTIWLLLSHDYLVVAIFLLLTGIIPISYYLRLYATALNKEKRISY